MVSAAHQVIEGTRMFDAQWSVLGALGLNWLLPWFNLVRERVAIERIDPF